MTIIRFATVGFVALVNVFIWLIIGNIMLTGVFTMSPLEAIVRVIVFFFIVVILGMFMLTEIVIADEMLIGNNIPDKLEDDFTDFME